MEKKDDFLMNAEIAFSNRQYNESLMWFRKVLDKEPNNIYVLSKAGAICVPLGLFDDALSYFGKAKDLDPNNGDNVFNYANACFFKKDNVEAFSAYVEAEKLGCSEDVIPRLYYQMALLCSVRQDIKSALIYFDKCEKADKTGIIALTSDFITEKMKMHMVLEDYTNAEKCARKLIAVKPDDFRNYMLCFSIEMVKKDYVLAENVLNDANEYAELSAAEKQTLLLQYSALYAAMGENEPYNKEMYYNRAIDTLEKKRKNMDLTAEQRINLLLTLSEVYIKAEKYRDALNCLDTIVNGANKKETTQTDTIRKEGEITFDEIEQMIEQDMILIQKAIDFGKMDPNMGDYVDTDYDESGELVRVYDDSVFAVLNKSVSDDNIEDNLEVTEEFEGKFDLPLEIREKVYFLYVTCFDAMDDYKNAEIYATILKYSSNKYYNYFGLYSSTMFYRKINGDNEQAKTKYAETIAFFRSKSFSNPSDTLAVVFRARLYAEEGKYEKAKELGNLLSNEDRNNILAYIEECKGLNHIWRRLGD